jgi:hypothetical protein
MQSVTNFYSQHHGANKESFTHLLNADNISKGKTEKLNKIGPNYCGINFSIQIVALTSVYALKIK